jgi:hypothetical protein
VLSLSVENGEWMLGSWERRVISWSEERVAPVADQCDEGRGSRGRRQRIGRR